MSSDMTTQTDNSRRQLLAGLFSMPLLGLYSATSAQTAPGAVPTTTKVGELLMPTRFKHPGLLYTAAGLQLARDKVQAGERPWIDGWNALVACDRNSPTAAPNPQTTIIRGGPGTNFGKMVVDMQRALNCALAWKISGHGAYAEQAVRVLNAWARTMTQLTGNNDQLLAAGIYGYQWANAAELMRDYPGWAPADISAFQAWLLQHFYPKCSAFLTGEATIHDATTIYANWDICAMCAVLAIGVFCDKPELYAEALRYFQDGRGMGAAAHMVFVVHPGKMGQMQEAGRDQGHATLSIALGGALCEMAWNQGTDLYGYLDNRLLAGAEYVARCNLLDVHGQRYSLPFTPQFAFANNRRRMVKAATDAPPSLRSGWELVYNHYVNRQGIEAPHVRAMVARMYPGVQDNGGDQPSFGTLTHRELPSAPATCTGLTAINVDSAAHLSWWGSAGAVGYEIGRRKAPWGGYAVVANVTGPTCFIDHPGNGDWEYAVRPMFNGSRGPWSKPARTSLPGKEVLRLAAAGGAHLQLQGGATWGTGRRGGASQALVLGGNGAHARFINNVTANVGDFSVSVWLYAEAYGPDTGLVFIGRDDVGYMSLSTSRYMVDKLMFVMSLAGYEGEDRLIDSQAPPLGRWVHLAVTRSGNGTGILYRDGVEVARNTAMSFLPNQIVQAQRCYIGRDTARAWSPNPGTFKGKVEDLVLFSRVLSPAEVAALASAATNLAPFAKLASSFTSPWESLAAVNDGAEPAHSGDRSRGAYGNWRGPAAYRETDWVSFTWPTEKTITAVEVYWWQDGQGIALPTHAAIEAWTGRRWQKLGSIGKAPDTFNRLEFAALTTTAVRVSMRSPRATGILEARVLGS